MRDTRALTNAVSYTLIVAIALTLTTGLVFGSGQLIESRQEQTAREQLEVVGEQLGASISTADGLNATDKDPMTLSVTRRFPQRIAGSQYRILVADNDTAPTAHDIYLETVNFDINVTVPVRTQSSDLRRTRVNGGTIRVRYDEPSRQLVVENA